MRVLALRIYGVKQVQVVGGKVEPHMCCGPAHEHEEGVGLPGSVWAVSACVHVVAGNGVVGLPDEACIGGP